MPVKISNAKKTRNMRRLISFLQTKIVTPPVRILSLSYPTAISILPTSRPLSISKPVLTDLPPETPEHVFPTSRRPNHPSNPLIMELSRNQSLNSNISIRNSSLLDGRIPQLDGSIPNILYNNSIHYPQPKTATVPTPCIVCKKTFENEDDVKWHWETKYGREDCSILRSMLPP